ncbi:MAG: hypothetical protein FWC50_14430 [Planctomycetaceae bacterium]|nr:hypothetical protein [Planctomycetaceae bacterium]
MPCDFQTASQQSQSDFLRILQNPLEQLLEGRIVSTEGNGEIGHLLDTRAGIDAILDHPKYGLLGIGIRIQYGRDYRTFTIRKQRETQVKTEYAKHADAMLEGGITTKFNIHAYIDEKTGLLLSAAIALTRDIYDCIDKGLGDVRMTGNDQIGRATFYVVDWDTLRDNGLWIHEFNQNKQEALCQK